MKRAGYHFCLLFPALALLACVRAPTSPAAAVDAHADIGDNLDSETAAEPFDIAADDDVVRADADVSAEILANDVSTTEMVPWHNEILPRLVVTHAQALELPDANTDNYANPEPETVAWNDKEWVVFIYDSVQLPMVPGQETGYEVYLKLLRINDNADGSMATKVQVIEHYVNSQGSSGCDTFAPRPMCSHLRDDGGVDFLAMGGDGQDRKICRLSLNADGKIIARSPLTLPADATPVLANSSCQAGGEMSGNTGDIYHCWAIGDQGFWLTGHCIKPTQVVQVALDGPTKIVNAADSSGSCPFAKTEFNSRWFEPTPTQNAGLFNGSDWQHTSAVWSGQIRRTFGKDEFEEYGIPEQPNAYYARQADLVWETNAGTSECVDIEPGFPRNQAVSGKTGDAALGYDMHVARGLMRGQNGEPAWLDIRRHGWRARNWSDGSVLAVGDFAYAVDVALQRVTCVPRAEGGDCLVREAWGPNGGPGGWPQKKSAEGSVTLGGHRLLHLRIQL